MKLVDNFKLKMGSKMATAKIWWSSNGPYVKHYAGLGLDIAGDIGSMISSKKQIEANKAFNDLIENARSIEGHEEKIEYIKAHVNDVMKKVGFSYGPWIVCWVGGKILIESSWRDATTQMMLLAANLAALEANFETYRANVRAAEGDEADYKYATGAHDVTIEENGKKTVIKDAPTGIYIPHAFIWGPSCTEWDENPEISRKTLELIYNGLEERKHRNGYLTMNYDILKMCGHAPIQTEALCVVPDKKEDGTDNPLSFGFDDDIQSVRDYLDGKSSTCLIRVNADMLIYDLPEKFFGDRVLKEN